MKTKSLFLTLGFFLIILSCIFSGGLPAQQDVTEETTSTETPPLSYSVQVEIAQIVIRINDKDRNWVRGIKTSDLELLEDGVLLEIRYIDEFNSNVPAAESTPAPVPTQTTIVPVRPALPSSIILIFDQCNSGPNAIEKHKTFVKEFLRGYNNPNTLFSLVAIKPTGDYEMLQTFTTQKDLLIRAIDEIHGAGGIGFDQKRFNVSQVIDGAYLEGCVRFRGEVRDTCIDNALSELVSKVTSLAQEQHLHSSNSIRSLKKLFAVAAHAPGQKSVILISEGMDPAGSFYYGLGAGAIDHFIRHYNLPSRANSYRTRIQAEANQYMSGIQEIRELIRSSNASGLSIYWANPEYGKGIDNITSELEATASFTPGLAGGADPELAMRGLAEDTGGLAMSSSNFSKFYDRLKEQIPNYYVISYKPPRPLNDGKFHRVEVRAKNKDHVVNHGKEYKDFEVKDRILNQLAAAHDFPQLAKRFPIIAEVKYFKQSDGAYHLMIHTGIPYTEIEPQSVEDGIRDDIHLSFIIRDTKEKILFDTHPILKLRSTQSDFDTFKKQKALLQYVQNYTAKSGVYQLSIAAMDVAGWRTAAQVLTIDLPGSAEKCPSLSPILLSSVIYKSDKPVAAPTVTEKGEILYGDKIFAFPVRPQISPTGSLNGFYQIYNAKLPSLYVKFKLYRGDAEFMNETPEQEIKEYNELFLKLITNFFSVPYKNLAPGTYTLELTARQSGDACRTSAKNTFDVVSQEN